MICCRFCFREVRLADEARVAKEIENKKIAEDLEKFESKQKQAKEILDRKAVRAVRTLYEIEFVVVISPCKFIAHPGRSQNLTFKNFGVVNEIYISARKMLFTASNIPLICAYFTHL